MHSWCCCLAPPVRLQQRNLYRDGSKAPEAWRGHRACRIIGHNEIEAVRAQQQAELWQNNTAEQEERTDHCRQTRGSTKRCSLRSRRPKILTRTSVGKAVMRVGSMASRDGPASAQSGIRQRRFLLLLARPGEFSSRHRRCLIGALRVGDEPAGRGDGVSGKF